MTPEIVSPDAQSAWAMFWANLGSVVIGGALMGVVSVMAWFTRRHISSMDEINNSVQQVARAVAGLTAQVDALTDGQHRLDDRVSRLEDRALDDGK